MLTKVIKKYGLYCEGHARDTVRMRYYSFDCLDQNFLSNKMAQRRWNSLRYTTIYCNYKDNYVYVNGYVYKFVNIALYKLRSYKK